MVPIGGRLPTATLSFHGAGVKVALLIVALLIRHEMGRRACGQP